MGEFWKLFDWEHSVGASIGALGRHTQITPDGIPVFDGRMEVFLKVVPDDPTVICLTVLT